MVELVEDGAIVVPKFVPMVDKPVVPFVECDIGPDVGDIGVDVTDVEPVILGMLIVPGTTKKIYNLHMQFILL